MTKQSKWLASRNKQILADNCLRLKELLAIKRNSEAILDDDTVNSWFTNGEWRYTKEQVNKAAEDYRNAVKETDLIIENL